MNRILITGASGFVGRHFTRCLLAQEYDVRALIRGSAYSHLHGVTAIPCDDIGDRQAVCRAVHGVDTVIHLAGHAHVTKTNVNDDPDAYRKVNVEGTRAVVEAAADAGVRRILYLSSVAAVGARGDCHIDANTRPVPRTPYGVSKLAAERVVSRIAQSCGMHAVILRPPAIYGPFMRGNIPRLFDLIRRGVPVPVPFEPKNRSLLYVGNLVDAALALLDTAPTGARTYLVADGEVISSVDLVHLIGRLLGRRPRVIPVPVGLMRTLGVIGDKLSTIRPVPLSSTAVDALFSSLTLDTSAICMDSKYRPRFALEDGMRVAAEWFVGVNPS